MARVDCLHATGMLQEMQRINSRRVTGNTVGSNDGPIPDRV